nr:UBN2 domain-containing protein [Tanacetum cinerariifolium]
ALHPKRRAKIMAIEESKYLPSLPLDELIENLKVHELVMEKNSKIYKGKKERVKSIALKSKKESSNDETSTPESDNEEYAMVVRNFKKFFRKRVDLLDNHEKKISHSGKGMIRKARVIGNTLDAAILIISLANVQSLNEIRIKRRSLEVLGAIAKMKPRTKPMMKLVSWLNRQMRTKPISFVGLSARNKTNRSTIKVHESMVMNINKGTKSKQKQTKPSTKQKA